MIARTKAAKLRQRRGRPYDEEASREPNGRQSRAKEPADRLALETRARHAGLTIVQAKDQRAETFIGYLNILGSRDGLSDRQYAAAIEYIDLRNDWLKSKKAPGAKYDSEGRGGGGDFVTVEYEDWCATVNAAYLDCRAAIQEAQNQHRGENLWAALDYCIVRDIRLDHMVGSIRLVCNALAKYFKIPCDPKT